MIKLMSELIDLFQFFFRSAPLGLVFLGLCVLPIFPIPSTGLILIAGICFSERMSPLMACFFCFLALAISFFWSYVFYSWVGSVGFLHRLLKRTSLDERIFALGHWNLAFLVRFLPAVPLFLQTALLGVSRISFFPYFVASLSAQALTIPILVFGGKAMFDWVSSPWIVVSIFLLVVGLLKLVSFLSKRLTQQSAVVSGRGW